LGGAGSSGSLNPLGRESGGSSPAAQDGTGTDVVNLSGASNLIGLARDSSAPDRASRIATLTAQIRSGSYQADLTAVSRSILNEFAAA
jgi:anti-sigma28 factor (negative regulator of flagellin synthesis)